MVWRQELHIRFSQAAVDRSARSEDATVELWTTKFVRDFLASTEYASSATLNRWVPGVLDELRGMAESAGVSYEQLLCMQHRAEIEQFGASICNARMQRNEITTSVAVCGVRKTACPALLAQCVELEPSRSHYLTVLEIGDSVVNDREQPAMMLLAHPGQNAPLCGVNARAVAVVADLLPQLACSSTKGGICAGFAVRAALAQNSFEDALNVRNDFAIAVFVCNWSTYLNRPMQSTCRCCWRYLTHLGAALLLEDLTVASPLSKHRALRLH